MYFCLSDQDTATVSTVLPVTGTFLNLVYQDVRNKYTNPPYMDYADPALWTAKVQEMHQMGMEYLILMAVANDGLSFYPSGLMPWAYPSERQSPVDAIMETAAANGMKVFMSTGWAKDQDDNLRIPAVKQRQIEMMNELAGLYGDPPAMYGWYLPVEDCFGPVVTDYAVEAVNALTDMARALTPGKKVLISPYGIFNSDFDDPASDYQLGQPLWSAKAYEDYMAWKAGDRYWKAAEAAFLGKYGAPAREIPDSAWDIRESGVQHKAIQLEDGSALESLLVRMLMCSKDDIGTPDMLVLSYSQDGKNYRLLQTRNSPVFPNTRHDAYVDCILFDSLTGKLPAGPLTLRLTWTSTHRTAIDRLILNP